MSRTFQDTTHWSAKGTELFLRVADGLGENGYGRATSLPGWTRKHLVGHVAANAEALGNLVRWAATGVETPMYPSPEERAADIEKATTFSAHALDAWLADSAERLAEAMGRLTDEQWQRRVVTAQGKTVAATELPWMRAREVYVHAVDLDRGVTFVDLPEGFLLALRDEIQASRGLTELPEGPLAEITAWLAGRPNTLREAPELGPWL